MSNSTTDHTIDQDNCLACQEERKAPMTLPDDIELVNRLEVIDDTGRAYVKGEMYGTPVSVKLDYQDNGRTLKVFVSSK